MFVFLGLGEREVQTVIIYFKHEGMFLCMGLYMFALLWNSEKKN